MNVGLDPVQNLSKSGLKPDYDDQDAQEVQKVWKLQMLQKVTNLCMQPKSNQDRNRIKIKPNQAKSKSKSNQILGNPSKNPNGILVEILI